MAANEFDSLAAEVFSLPSAKAAVGSVGDRNPDREARVQRDARTLGVPYESARADEKQLWRSIQGDKIKWGERAKTAPHTVHFLTSTSRAAIAHDDIDTLESIERGLAAFGRPIARAIDRAVMDDEPAIKKVARGAEAFRKGDFNQRNLAAGLASGAVRGVGGLAGVGERAARVFGADDLADRAASNSQRYFDLAARLRPTYATRFGRDVMGAFESAPSSLAALGVTLLTRNPVWGAIALGEVTGGESYHEAVKAGVPHERALLYSLLDEGLEAGTELFPLKGFLGDVASGKGLARTALGNVIRENIGEQVATLGQDFDRWAFIDGPVNGKPFKDFLAEIPDAALSTFIQTTALAGAMSSAGYAVDKGFRLTERAEKRAQVAEEARQHLADLFRLAEASKLRERDPETFQGLIDDMAEGSPAEDVYVAPDKLGELLFQSPVEGEGEQTKDDGLQPARDALASRLEEAVDQGTDVRIPVGEFATLLAGKTDALLDHVKINPSGMTRAEAQAFMASDKAKVLQREVEESLAADAPWREEVEAIRSKVKARLDSAGRFTPAVNQRYADLHAAFYATMAKRLKMSPGALYERFHVRIVNRAMGESNLEQKERARVSPTLRAALDLWGEGRLDEAIPALLAAEGELADHRDAPDVLYRGLVLGGKEEVEKAKRDGIDLAPIRDLESWSSDPQAVERFMRGSEHFIIVRASGHDVFTNTDALFDQDHKDGQREVIVRGKERRIAAGDVFEGYADNLYQEAPHASQIAEAARNGGRGFIALGAVPAALVALGAKAGRLSIGRGKIAKDIEDHGTPIAVLQALPDLLADPLAAWTDHSHADRINVLLDARDGEGRWIVATVGPVQGGNVVFTTFGLARDADVDFRLKQAKDAGRTSFDKGRRPGPSPTTNVQGVPGRQGRPILSIRQKGKDEGELHQSDEGSIFYSELERAVESSTQAKASPQQWLATLAKTPGVKKEEIEWTELPEWLGSQDGPVTREELLAFVRAGGVQVEEVAQGSGPSEEAIDQRQRELMDDWVQEQMRDWSPKETEFPEVSQGEDGQWFSGAESTAYETEADAQAAAQEWYDDVVAYERSQEEESLFEQAVTGWAGMPDFYDQALQQLRYDAEGSGFESYTEDGGEDYTELLLTLPAGVRGNPDSAPSTHWDTRGVVAHLRFKTRATVDGKRLMFIEEVQSDWHQKGRDQGYAVPATPEEIAEAEGQHEEAVEKHGEAIGAFNKAVRAALDAKREALKDVVAPPLPEVGEENNARRFLESFVGDALTGSLAGLRSAESAIRMRLDEGLGEDFEKLRDFAKGQLDLAERDALVAESDKLDSELTNTDPSLGVSARTAYRLNLEYRLGVSEEALDAAALELNEASHRVDNARNSQGIPDAPFKATWPALAMKRAIRWAADNGFEAVAWTTGDQQRERYNLADAVGEIRAQKQPDGRYGVAMPNNNTVGSAIIDRGLAERRTNDIADNSIVMTPEQIAEVFGKDLGTRMMALADQAPNANPVSLQGDDLKIGGEGMLAFYDRNLVNITNNILKKLGGKVEMIPVEGWEDNESRRKRGVLLTELNRVAGLSAYGIGSRAEAEERIEHYRGNIARGEGDAEKAQSWIDQLVSAMPLIDEIEQLDPLGNLPLAREGARVVDYLGGEEKVRGLAAEMKVKDEASGAEESGEGRALVKAGANLYHSHLSLTRSLEEAARLPAALANVKGTNPGFVVTDEMKAKARQGFALFQKNRGAYSPATDTISLLEHADLSTFLHESGHFYLEVLSQLADEPGAPQQIVDDFDAVLKWFGVKDRATWNAMTLEQKREYHEKFARGFEAYLFTGKAPAVGLRDMFRDFRSWLLAVYRRARALAVRPTAEVRGVMDRLLATDEEIAEAEAARSMMPLFADEAQSGMTPDQWRDYQRTTASATSEAEAVLGRRSLRDLKWFENAKGREVAAMKRRAGAVRKAMAASVAAEVAAEPIYRAQQFFKKGALDGDQAEGPHKISIASIDALYPGDGEIKRRLGYGKYGVLAESGIDVDTAAQLFGFSSGDHLVQALLAAEPMKARIEGLTEQRLLEEHGDLTDDAAIEQAASEAVHNEFRARAVAAELAALATATGKPRMLAQAARQFAEDTIARTRVRDVKPAKYEAAAARAAKAAQEAFAKGETLTAAAEKRNQLFNLYATRAARRAQEEVDKALALFDRLTRPASAKAIDASYRDQIVQLLERFDLSKSASLKSIDKRISLAQWIERQQEMGFEPAIDEALVEASAKRSYKNMSIEDLRGLVDAVRNIEHLGRLKSKLLTAKKDRDFATAVDKAASVIEANAVKTLPVRLEKGGWAARAKDGALEFLALHRKFASLIRQMDGFKDGGTLWELFVRPMNAAGDKETTMRAQATSRLLAVMAPLKGAAMGTKRFIPELGASLSLEGRIAIALNLGNSTNRARVKDGDNWTDAQIEAVASSLTAEQWGVVQGIWDAVNAYWPEIAAKERRVTGIEPEKVEAEPLRVVTADGQTLDLPGGYYPIKYDADRSSRSEADNLAEFVAGGMRGLYTRASTRRGHTKSRVETVKRPIRKDLGVVVEHVSQVIHDLSWHEYLIDAQRLLRAGSIDAAIRDHYGPEVLRAMRKHFEDVAAGDIPAQDVFERTLGWLRTGATVAGMAWSFTTSLLQPLGLAQSVVRIGPKWVLKGMGRWMGDTARFQSTVGWIVQQSPMMAARATTMQREINEIRNEVTADKSRARLAIEASFFVMIAKMQLIADVPTWIGGYEKAVAAGEDQERAVALADQAVLDSQGGGQIKDLAGIQRGGPLRKLWTNFYSYFSVTYNLAAESVGETRLVGPERLPLLATDFLLLFVVPAVMQTLIFAALRGDDKDEEELMREAGWNILSSFTSSMVGVRDVSAAIQGNPRGAAPAGLVLDRALRFGEQARQGEGDEAFWRATNQMAGVIFHFPAAQIDRTVRGFEALRQGETGNPMALLLGPPQEARN